MWKCIDSWWIEIREVKCFSPDENKFLPVQCFIIWSCLAYFVRGCRCYRCYKNRKYVNKVCKYLESTNTEGGKVDRGVVMSNVKTLNEELTLNFVDLNLTWTWQVKHWNHSSNWKFCNFDQGYVKWWTKKKYWKTVQLSCKESSLLICFLYLLRFKWSVEFPNMRNKVLFENRLKIHGFCFNVLRGIIQKSVNSWI